MADYRGILICGDLVGNQLTTTTRELVSIGRKLSVGAGQPLAVLLTNENAPQAASEAIALGCGQVYIVDAPRLNTTHPDWHLGVVTVAGRRINPYIILMGNTDLGRTTAPRLAARLRGGVLMDCVELSVDPNTRRLQMTRPVYGGKAMAVWDSKPGTPQVVTIRPGSATPAEPDASNKGQVVNLTVEAADVAVRSELVETIREQSGETRLEEAKVIVAGGGGIGGKDGFTMIRELARILGGTLATSRAATDEGWTPSTMEVGQTGHIVKPDLYVAVGISGASQHMAGCLGAKYIVAINKDPNAYIFKVADLGIVGDYREVIPPLVEKLKALLAS